MPIPYIEIDCAAVRLEQTIVRKLGVARRYAAPARKRPARQHSGHEMSDYAVLIMPADTSAAAKPDAFGSEHANIAVAAARGRAVRVGQ